MTLNKRLPRLSLVWNSHSIYFLTICTYSRRKSLSSKIAADILIDELAQANCRHGWLVGRYVIMPDHVHFFCAEQRGGAKRNLSGFIRHWKEWTSKRISQSLSIPVPIWQKQFFDHVLRSNESYAEKWLYVRENPVRAGLVNQWADWRYQGYINFDEPL